MALPGSQKHIDRLRRMRTEHTREIVRGLYAAGQEIEIEAEISITSGSISGKGHVPSAPGQAPNADTRRLDTSIETTVVAQNPPTVHVTSHAPYSAALEFGTSKMAERPFMRPATAKKRGEVTRRVANAVATVIRRPS